MIGRTRWFEFAAHLLLTEQLKACSAPPGACLPTPMRTRRSISKSITNVLVILLILLILRFPGSTAFCISTCMSRMLILAAVVPFKRHVQVAMGGSHAKSW